MALPRRAAALTAVLCAFMSVMGCSSTTTESEPGPSTSAESVAEYDVSRMSELRAAFPLGFVPGPPSEPIEVGDRLVDTVGAVVSYGKPFSVAPSQCRPLLKPVDGQLGAESMHVRGDGPDKTSMSVGATAPITVAAQIPTTGCDRMTYDVDQTDHPLSGTVERLVAPPIDGATTIALRFDVEGFPDVEYSYAAILDGQAYVDVRARLAPDYAAESVLSAFLVKAVAAVR